MKRFEALTEPTGETPDPYEKRRRRMANRKRNIQMKFYVTEEEKRLIGEYRTNRQESLTRDFSSEKGGKPQEYFVYFKVLLTYFWRKRSGRIRRRICAVLP